jgi:hypothetical protein
MSFFAIVAYTVVVVALGYMLGRSDGQDEGYLDGRSDVFKEMR